MGSPPTRAEGLKFPMILLIDNYDSFAHNLARYFNRLRHATTVVRNDELDLAQLTADPPRAIVLSPGPCTPQEAGSSLEIVRQFHQTVPMLGVCLGHQTISAALGGRIIRAPVPRHGQKSLILHDSSRLFEGIPPRFAVGRYHSLIVDEATLPAVLRITARCEDGLPMAMAHRSLPVFGVQFHPESILTEHGFRLLANFLSAAGISVESPLPELAEESPLPTPVFALPSQPITF